MIAFLFERFLKRQFSYAKHMPCFCHELEYFPECIGIGSVTQAKSHRKEKLKFSLQASISLFSRFTFTLLNLFLQTRFILSILVVWDVEI